MLATVEVFNPVKYVVLIGFQGASIFSSILSLFVRVTCSFRFEQRGIGFVGISMVVTSVANVKGNVSTLPQMDKKNVYNPICLTSLGSLLSQLSNGENLATSIAVKVTMNLENLQLY